MHTHRGDGVLILWNICAFLFVHFGSITFLIDIISRVPTQSLWSNLPPMGCTWTRLLYFLPPTRRICPFRWESSGLFTLGNRCTSSYYTYATDVAFPLVHHPVCYKTHVNILLCHLLKLCCMSKGSCLLLFNIQRHAFCLVCYPRNLRSTSTEKAVGNPVMLDR